jgi:hypothetical protein
MMNRNLVFAIDCMPDSHYRVICFGGGGYGLKEENISEQIFHSVQEVKDGVSKLIDTHISMASEGGDDPKDIWDKWEKELKK